MELHVGPGVSLKRTEICVSDGSGAVLWRVVADTPAGMIAEKPSVWAVNGADKVGHWGAAKSSQRLSER